MSENKTLLTILYRNEKSSVSQIEKLLAGALKQPDIAAVYEQKKRNVMELERRIGNARGD